MSAQGFGFSVLDERAPKLSPANYGIINVKSLGTKFCPLRYENFATETEKFDKTD